MPAERPFGQTKLPPHERQDRPSHPTRGLLFFLALHKVLPTEDKLQPHTSHVLDTTRAVAAGLVVLLHARIYALGGAPTGIWDNLTYAVTNCGIAAVFWFFVISGYLVGGSVILEVAQTGQFDFRRYLINRMARLYIVLLPALAVGAIFDVARVTTWGVNARAGFETAASLSATTLVGNVFYLQTLLVPTFGSNLALWSLANEFWYYMLFPLLLAPLTIHRHPVARTILFSTGLLLLAFICSRNLSMAWLFALWCIGAVSRVFPIAIVKSQSLAWIFAATAMVSMPYLHPWIGLLATALVGVTFANAIVTTHGRTTASSDRWLNIVKLFSGFSFSLYLVHLPLQHLIVTAVGHSSDPFLYLPPRSIAAPATIVGLAGASYAAAFAFSRVTEANTGALRRWLFARVPRRLPS